MMNLFERTYGHVLGIMLLFLNPFKKAVITTECQVHQFINIQALQILKNDRYNREYEFLSPFITVINEGTRWADQDFKSSGHFYNPNLKKGLYGRKDAMSLAKEYYQAAVKKWDDRSFEQSLFYLGASLHLIQDMVVPQHANIRLLDDHRQYENFVKETYLHVNEFKAARGAYLLDSIEAYVRFNARLALKVHKRFKEIPGDDQRFYQVTKCILPLAERTTAGCMMMFSHDILNDV